LDVADNQIDILDAQPLDRFVGQIFGSSSTTSRLGGGSSGASTPGKVRLT
jgi:hypothetical protein